MKKHSFNIFNFICFVLFIFLHVGCQTDEIKESLSNRTIIVYMIADNNLDNFSIQDINEIEEGWKDDFDGNLIVYIDRAEGARPSHPIVYRIGHDTTQTIKSKIVQVYSEQNSADPVIMNNVLSQIINEYPAQSYGLVLWSHGSAWFPNGTELNNRKSNVRKFALPITKSFGKDGTNELNIIDLKNVLPLKFEFIIFDACYMGSVEVLYELKNKADYIISSSTEVLSSGYPYNLVVPFLFQQTIDYKSVANSFFESYFKLDGVMQSATVSVVKTSELTNLAKSVSEIMSDINDIKLADYEHIQQYTTNDNKLLFDLKGFITNTSQNSEKTRMFSEMLDKAVIFKVSTNKILDELVINGFFGLSIFIPNSNNNKYYDFYKQYEWFKDFGYNNYFNKFNYNNQ